MANSGLSQIGNFLAGAFVNCAN